MIGSDDYGYPERLWVLREREGLPKAESPWHPWYDTMSAIVVRAASEIEARVTAHTNAGAENRNAVGNPARVVDPWLHAKYTTCEELYAFGNPGVIVKDVNEA